jgi:hypothetical protein
MDPLLDARTVTPEIGELLMAMEPLRVRIAGVARKSRITFPSAVPEKGPLAVKFGCETSTVYRDPTTSAESEKV